MEIWKPVVGYEKYYEVSNYGRIRTLHNRVKSISILKQSIRSGYYAVNLCVNDIRKRTPVHRLVANAFIENPLNKPQINHKDGNKFNNHIGNLEWCTASENIMHAYNNRLRVVGKGRLNHLSKPVIQYSLGMDFIMEHENIHLASIHVGRSRCSISGAVNNKTKTSAGFIWKLKHL